VLLLETKDEDEGLELAENEKVPGRLGEEDEDKAAARIALEAVW